MLKILSTFVFNFLQLQERSGTVEMADKLRDNGKIYVVVTIISIIMIGLLLYLISLDRKISKLEK